MAMQGAGTLAALLAQAALELDIEVGDTLLGGRYKNIPHKVEELGTDELGQPTVNGMKLLAFRIAKKMPKQMPKQGGAGESPLAVMLEARRLSDMGDYAGKHALMGRLMADRPGEFKIEAGDGHVVGVTHVPTGFRVHLPAHMAALAGPVDS